MFDVKTSSETHKESNVFKSGNKLVTTNLPWGKIGLSICFDLRFLKYTEICLKEI